MVPGDGGSPWRDGGLRHPILEERGHILKGRDSGQHGVSAGGLYPMRDAVPYGSREKRRLPPAAPSGVLQPGGQHFRAAPALEKPQRQFRHVRVPGAVDEPGRGGDEFLIHPESGPGGGAACGVAL